MAEADPIPAAEVANMLVLSTAHLRESTCCDWLIGRPCAHVKQDIGWFVYVCEDPGAGEDGLDGIALWTPGGTPIPLTEGEAT